MTDPEELHLESTSILKFLAIIQDIKSNYAEQMLN